MIAMYRHRTTKDDRRQLNDTWEFTNHLGEMYRFGRIGSGKNAYIKTLAYLGKENTSGQSPYHED